VLFPWGLPLSPSSLLLQKRKSQVDLTPEAAAQALKSLRDIILVHGSQYAANSVDTQYPAFPSILRQLNCLIEESE
jgi:hypothetical protein